VCEVCRREREQERESACLWFYLCLCIPYKHMMTKKTSFFNQQTQKDSILEDVSFNSGRRARERERGRKRETERKGER